jgi:hypothetical protein
VTANRVWVDADACPGVIRDILFRAAGRTGVAITFVANQNMRVPKDGSVSLLVVAAGLDVADSEIVRRLHLGDLVITSDIPLAAEVIAKGAHALSHRGELYSSETIGALLNMRDFLDTMRGSGIITGGPPPLGKSDRKAFADHLDRILTKFIQDG